MQFTCFITPLNAWHWGITLDTALGIDRTALEVSFAHVSIATEWSAIGRPVKYTYCCEHRVSIWATLLPSLYHHCASFGRPMASIERSQWRPLCLHSATTATLQPPWQWFCLHSASFVRPVAPLQQIWSFKEGTRVVLQQLHRNRTFWVWPTTERRGHFSGRSKVAALCKGGFRHDTAFRDVTMGQWRHNRPN